MSGAEDSKAVVIDRARLDAIDRSLCVVEFSTDRVILDANRNMLAALGYAREDVVGRHHSILLNEADRGAAYDEFWRALCAGEFRQGEFRRVDQHGNAVWFQASYNPVFDASGRVERIVKYATDITRAKTLSADHAAQLDALHRSQAVIEFRLDGIIVAANRRFLEIFGYEEREIVGQHHRRLVRPDHAHSGEYRAFWGGLRSGSYVADECERVAKDGRTIWLQASYNPVREADGRVTKIVKVASDITTAKTLSLDHAAQMTAISRSQAVVEFAIDGTILSANDLFLDAVGYSRDELVGHPHSTLVAPEEATSAAYAGFWEKLRGGRFFSAEFRRVAKGGRTIWIQGSYNPVFNADGRVIKVVKFATEVTDLVAQRTRFQQLSLVADNTDNSVIITNAERRIQYVNRGFERLTGYTAEEAIGRVPGDFLQGPLTDRTTVTSIGRHLANRRSFYDEILNYTKAGEAYWVSLAINPVQDDAGELAGYISIQANITETKRAALAQGVTLDAIGRMNAIVEWDADGALKLANEALSAWGGALNGAATSLSNLLSRGQVEALRAGTTVQCDIQWPSIEGEKVHLDAQFSPVPSLDGGAGGFVMCAVDVSERRQAQARAMEAMQENADQIGDFVTRIRAIASNTTIIALNASIEAARTGEAGRGFSVLAGEVRSLSTQCGDAANQISGLLERNSRRVDDLRMPRALAAAG